MSWHLPDAPLLGRVVAAQLLALVAAVAVAMAVTLAVPAGNLFVLKTVLAFVAIGAVTLGYVAGDHPFTEFGAANTVTTLRASLVSIVAALVGEAPSDAVAWTAAAIGVMVTALDGLDGWLARRDGTASAFGARYDMEVDALLILALAVLAWGLGKAGAWIVLAGAMRYLFVAAGLVWRWMTAPLPVSVRRKTVCVVQVVGLGAVVSPFLAAPMSVVVAAATLLALTWSFGVDVIWLRRHSA